MVKLNVDRVYDFVDVLTFLEEYVPLRLSPYINNSERRKYLRDKGLYDKINLEKTQVKEKASKSDNPLKYLHDDFVSWVKKHPEFKDLLI